MWQIPWQISTDGPQAGQTPPSHELWSTVWYVQQVILQSNRFPLLWWLSKSFSYQMPIFLANLNISWLIASPCFLQRREPCTHHGLPGHRGINIAQSYFPALHNTAHAELQNHTGKLKHTHQCISCKEKHISSQQNTLQVFVWAFFSKDHTSIKSCPAERQRRKTAAGRRSCKPCPWLGMTNHQLHPGFYLESRHVQPLDHSLHLPQPSLSCFFLLVFGVGINTCLQADRTRVCIFLCVARKRGRKKAQLDLKERCLLNMHILWGSIAAVSIVVFQWPWKYRAEGSELV